MSLVSVESSWREEFKSVWGQGTFKIDVFSSRARGEKRGASGRKERKTTCCMMERLNLDDDDDEFGDELGECHYLVPKGVRRDDRSRQHI